VVVGEASGVVGSGDSLGVGVSVEGSGVGVAVSGGVVGVAVAGVDGGGLVWAGVVGGALVCAGVDGGALVCAGVDGGALVCAGVEAGGLVSAGVVSAGKVSGDVASVGDAFAVGKLTVGRVTTGERVPPPDGKDSPAQPARPQSVRPHARTAAEPRVERGRVTRRIEPPRRRRWPPFCDAAAAGARRAVNRESARERRGDCGRLTSMEPVLNRRARQLMSPLPTRTIVLGIGAAALGGLAVGAIYQGAVDVMGAPGSLLTPGASASPSSSASPSDTAGVSAATDKASAAPYERIGITGRVIPGSAGTAVHVQRNEGGSWKEFPASATTGADGGYELYVKSGRKGENSFRVVTTVEGSQVVSGAVVVRIG
jgi:hypothetical protein